MKHKKRNDKELLEFAKQIEDLYEASRAKRVLLFAFLKGVVTGLGIFLGGTIVVAMLLWGLSKLNWIPLIGPITQTIEENLQKEPPR